MELWRADAPGVIRLPSGRTIRGRGLRYPVPAGARPQFGLYLQGRPTPAIAWPSRRTRWPDWWLPLDPEDGRDALLELYRRAAAERVEVACNGGRGRTGKALACLAICDGVPPEEAVDYVRQHYNRRAVESPRQRAYVKRFRP